MRVNAARLITTAHWRGDRMHDRKFITDDDDRMTDLIQALVDQGLTRGLLAMTFTDGLSVSSTRGYDVAAVAAMRLLDTLPGHVSVHEVLDGLRRRAVALSEVQA